MVPRFRRIYTQRAGSVPNRYAREFPFPYKQSTFYDARRVYFGVPDDVLASFERAGHTPKGEWAAVVDWWEHNVRDAT